MKMMETTDLSLVIACLPEAELQRFLPMVAERLTCLRLDISQLGMLVELLKKVGVDSLPLIRHCMLLQPAKPKPQEDYSEHMARLGTLLPCLDQLHVMPALGEVFPRNLRQLRFLHVQHNISQSLFDQICERCPQLQQLYMRNEPEPTHHGTLDISCLAKCQLLRELQLPLLSRPSDALCQLRNLRLLSLHRQQLWPCMDWLPFVRNVISLKRYELRRLSFDGSWLTSPLDLTVLQLQHCWALEEVLLSNCKLANPQGNQLELPMSCQRLALQLCTFGGQTLLKASSQLRQLELYKCQLHSAGVGQMLADLVKQRQRLPTLHGLQLLFSESTSLRAELTSWTYAKRRYCSEWLQVRELNGDEGIWRQPLATITMTFGPTVSCTPNLNKLQDLVEPTPAQLLHELDKLLA